MDMSRSSPFDEQSGTNDIAADFPAIDDGQFVFEGKCLDYNQSGQTHYLDGQLGGESSSDYGATVLWKHVIKGKKCGNSHGGSHSFKCKHCHKIYQGTYTRVYAHLMGHKKGESKGIGFCSAVKGDKNLQMLLQREVGQAESSPSIAPLKKSKLNTTSAVTSNGPSLALSYTNPDEKDDQIQEVEDVDSRVIRCLCANGIPFDVLKSPFWEEMVSAIAKTPGYKSPSSEMAQTILLESERDRVEKEFSDFKLKWAQYGLSIILSGWPNVKNQPLINILASNQFGSMFLHGLDYAMVLKSPSTISECMVEAIDRVGPHNVVQLIMDDEPSCKATSEEVAKVYPGIFWTPCMVRTMKLIIKDLRQAVDNSTLCWIDRTYTAAKGVVKYIVYHHQAVEIFRVYPKLELLKAATTKWAHYIVLRLLLDLRDVFRDIVLSEHWPMWVVASNVDVKVKLSGDGVKAIVLSDNFWEAIQLVMGIIRPIYKIIRFADQEGPVIGEVCERMDNMLGEIKENLQGQEAIFSLVSQKILARWNKKHHILYCLAYALMPKYYNEEYFQSPAPGGLRRCKPDLDDVVFNGALAAIQRIHPCTDLCDTIRLQFAHFTDKKERFSSAMAKRDSRNPKMDVLQWWKFHGVDTKELRDMAFKVLAQPISTLSVERPWNTYDFIRKSKQKSVNASHTDDLSFVHSNLRLLSRFGSEYNYGPHRKWDVNSEISLPGEPSWKWGDIRFVGLEDEDPASGQVPQTPTAIQELLRMIEDPSCNSAQSLEQAQVTGSERPRGRGRGIGSPGSFDQKGKTKKFL